MPALRNDTLASAAADSFDADFCRTDADCVSKGHKSACHRHQVSKTPRDIELSRKDMDKDWLELQRKALHLNKKKRSDAAQQKLKWSRK